MTAHSLAPTARRRLALLVACLVSLPIVGVASASAAAPQSVWVSPVSGVYEAWGADVAPDGSIYSVVGGNSSWGAATMTFGTGPGAITITPSTGSQTGMVLGKQNATGSWEWVWGSATNPSGWGVTAMPDSGAVVVGYRDNASATGTVGSNTVPAQGSFAARFTSAGAISWYAEARPTVALGGSDNIYLNGVSAIPGGGGASIVGGYYSNGMAADLLPAVSPISLSGLGRAGGTTFLAGLSASGSWTWALPADAGNSGANGVKALPDGSAIAGGFLSGSARFGSTTLTGTGVFFAKGSAAGWQWAAQAAYSGTSYLAGVSKNFSLGPDGSLYYTDSFTGTATFGTGPGAISLTSTGDKDVFVAKLNPNGTWAWAVKAGGALEERAYSVVVPPGVCSPVVTGVYTNTAQFGSFSLTSSTPSTRENFLATISATDGAWTSADNVAKAASLWHQGPVVALADGSIIVQGSAASPTTFGTLPVSTGNYYSGKMLQVPCIAPPNVKATAGDGKVTVSWDAVPGGSVTSYTVTAGPGGKTCTATAPATSCVVEGLTNGTEYSFTVVANNAAGAGPASSAVKATPTAAAAAASSASTPTTKAKRPVIRILSASISNGSRMVATVRVNRAGRVSVAGVLGGVKGCTAKATARKAGVLTVSCMLGSSARARAVAGVAVLRVTAQLSASGRVARDAARSTVQPYAPTPVTG